MSSKKWLVILAMSLAGSAFGNGGGHGDDGEGSGGGDPHGGPSDPNAGRPVSVVVDTTAVAVAGAASRSTSTAASSSESRASGGVAIAGGGNGGEASATGGEGGAGGQGGNAGATASNQGNAIGSNNTYQEAPQTAIAYATQCGSGIGVSNSTFSASVTGETQYCKELRMAAMYEALFIEAKHRGDNDMAKVWYVSMVDKITRADEQITGSDFTGRVKDTAQDVAWPVALCGGIGVVASWTPAGWICGGILAGKAIYDMEKKKEVLPVSELIQQTDFTTQTAPVAELLTKDEAVLIATDLQGNITERLDRQAAIAVSK